MGWRLLCVISGSRAREDLHLVAERFPHQRCARWRPGRLTVDTAGVRNIAIEGRAGRLCGPRGGDELVPCEYGSLRERGGWCRNRRVRGKCRESRWWDGDGGLRSRRQSPRGKRGVGRGRCRCRGGLALLLFLTRQNDENERHGESDDKTQTSVARHLPSFIGSISVECLDRRTASDWFPYGAKTTGPALPPARWINLTLGVGLALF